MSTKSSRKALCFLLALMMVVGSVLFLSSTVIRGTLCSQRYMEYFVSSRKVSAYCNDVYAQRIAVLADNSGIPTRVFEGVEGIAGYNETVVSRFFTGSDTTVFTQDRIDSYEKLIKEYLDGNEIVYSEENVHNTAVEAAKIYADSFGIKNTDTFKDFVDRVDFLYGKLSSAGITITLVGIVLIFILFTEKKKARIYYSSAFAATGLSCVFIGVFSLIFGIGKGGVITPSVYEKALFSAINGMFLIFIAIGVIITAVSVINSLKLHKLTKSTRNK